MAEADPRIAAVGPKIYYHSQPQRLWFAGGVLSLWRGWPSHRGLRREDHGQYDTPADVDYLYFVRKADCKSHFFTISAEEFNAFLERDIRC